MSACPHAKPVPETSPNANTQPLSPQNPKSPQKTSPIPAGDRQFNEAGSAAKGSRGQCANSSARGSGSPGGRYTPRNSTEERVAEILKQLRLLRNELDVIRKEPLHPGGDIAPRIRYLKLVEVFPNGSRLYNIDGGKILLRRPLARLLETLSLDHQPSEDKLVYFKSIDELQRRLGYGSRSSVHSAVGRLRDKLAEELFFSPEVIRMDRDRGYRLGLLTTRDQN